jgi:hypothetical protein
MKRRKEVIYCKCRWERPGHKTGDGLGMPGTCGACGGTASFRGNIPEKHIPGNKRRR